MKAVQGLAGCILRRAGSGRLAMATAATVATILRSMADVLSRCDDQMPISSRLNGPVFLLMRGTTLAFGAAVPNALGEVNDEKILRIQRAPTPHWVGNGFHVNSPVFYGRDAEAFSPFLMLDYRGAPNLCAVQ